MWRETRTTALWLTAFLLAAIPGLARAADGASPTLAGTVWLLVEVQGRPVPPPAPGAERPRLVFDAGGARVEGFGGCNRFSGPCELGEGDRIRFGDLAATMMACPDMETEALLFEALRAADSFALGGAGLSLNRARMAPLARFEAAR